MNQLALLKKRLNRKLSDDDDLSGDMIRQEKACLMDEADMIFDKDLLSSGRDLFELEGGLDDDYISIDHIIASQTASIFRS